MNFLSKTIILTLFLFSTTAFANNLNKQLIKAVEMGQNKTVIELLDKGANPNTRDSKGNSVLLIAAEWGRATIAKTLIAYGANKNARNKNGETALAIAEAEEYKILAKVLRSDIKLIAKKSSTGNNIRKIDRALLGAAEYGQVHKVVALLKKGADINVQNDKGFTPLMLAAKWARATTIKVLIELGADKNMKNKSGYTAEKYVLDTEHKKSIRYYANTKILKGPASKISQISQKNQGEFQ